MKRLTLLAVLLPSMILLHSLAYSQGGWVAQNSGITTFALLCVRFVENSMGWTVGDFGTILHTTDTGVTWLPQTSGTGEHLNSVHFESTTTGWAAGNGGTIKRTTDGGNSWGSQISGTGSNIYSIYFVDASLGWASGSNGTILHTTNGGNTWNAQSSGTDVILNIIHFADAISGGAVGNSGVIRHTTNGGNTWIAQTSGTGSYLNSIFWLDATIGWVVGQNGTILHTTNSGSTWNAQSSGTTGWLVSVYFVDGSTGWAVGDPGIILHTTNGGVTWNFQSSGTTMWLRSVYFIDGRIGWTVGSGGVILHTTTGGAMGDPLAQFDVCYGATGSADPLNPGALITIDPTTGKGTLVGPTGIIGSNGPSVPALAIRSTGEIYALSASNSSDLYTINASTGVGTFVAKTGLVSPDALAFDANDLLYAVANNNNLYTVDENTGATSLIGPTGFATKALAYDPTDGTMYGSSANDEIYTVDLETGSSTLVGTTGLLGSIHAIRFDQEGNLYGTKGNSQTVGYNLIAIDKVTGAGTTIGPISFVAVLGLASRVLSTPVIPVTVDVEIDPSHQFVPAEGDTFAYTMTFTNHTSQLQVIDWWTKVERPVGDPIDPLSGPEIRVLDRFETLVIDTAMLPIPFNAVAGDYSLIAYIGRYLSDTLGTDTSAFTKLPSVSCGDISAFQARCRPGGLMQARVTLFDNTHAGDVVEISIDQFPYLVTIGNNRQGVFSQTGFNLGVHTVELTDPPGCFPATTANCPAGLGKDDGNLWDDNENWEVPSTTALLENYPDPFNPSTTIRYTLSEDVHVTLSVYNMLGQLVATLVDEPQATGYKSVVWNGRNDSGGSVSSGIYIYRISVVPTARRDLVPQEGDGTTGDFTGTRRMLLLK